MDLQRECRNTIEFVNVLWDSCFKFGAVSVMCVVRSRFAKHITTTEVQTSIIAWFACCWRKFWSGRGTNSNCDSSQQVPAARH